MVSIIGVGTGISMITKEATERLKEAQMIIGAARVVDSYEELFEGGNQKVVREYDVSKIKEIIEDHKAEKIVVFVSGDTGFYSLADSLRKELDDHELEYEIIPGISSVNSFFAKLKMSWQDATLLSVHGRNRNFVDAVRRNQKTFLLTGNNIPEIAEALEEAGFGNLVVYVGSNLDTKEECITKTVVSALRSQTFSALTVLLILHDEADDAVPSGIPDEEFIRGQVPMTKAEVRANIISKLGLKPNDVCYDIGAGTGSVTVEMALAAWKGSVIAIEKNQEGIELIKQNLRKFHIGNTKVLCGEATEILKKQELPIPDVAFIGGSDGHLEEILSLLLQKNENIRIVVSAIALETLQKATESFKAFGRTVDITQISVAKNKDVAGLNLMMANNPVYLIKGI